MSEKKYHCTHCKNILTEEELEAHCDWGIKEKDFICEPCWQGTINE